VQAKSHVALLFAFLLWTSGSTGVATLASPPLRLWFSKPAKTFRESRPVGNGRFGGLMFGGVRDERIVIEERADAWSFLIKELR